MTDIEAKPIELALQGGGSHGAFTWGVLDRLLSDSRLRIAAISGTSAGAMNAVVVADGLTRGGAEEARNALKRFWEAVADAAMASPFRRSSVDTLLGRWSIDHSPGFHFFEWLTRSFSPYDLNPLNLNPLRDLLVEQVDFDSVRRCTSIKLFVAATNVRTGQAKIFRNADMTAEALMASACLPFLYQAVEIDGEAYWDGGYMGNPVLFPLLDESETNDLVIVQINPIRRDVVPRSAREIMDRLNEITFNASLIKDLRSIMLLKGLVDEEGLNRATYKNMLLHRIAAEDELKDLGASSKLNADRDFLSHLHGIGWQTTDDWLKQNFEEIGKSSTFDAGSLLS